jgi:hypothetical protein
VTLHPFDRLSSRDRDAFEAEALSMPIAGSGEAAVVWGD